MRQLLFCLMLLFPVLASGQRKLPPPGPPDKVDDNCQRKRQQCSNNHTYTTKQRRAFFPFNKAVTIRLISYEDNSPYMPLPIEKQITDIDPTYVFSKEKQDEFVADYSLVKEFINVSSKSVDLLTDILYNIGPTPIKCGGLEVVDPGAACYNPRNAILFIDRSGKTFAYMEFCFECQRYYFSSHKIKTMPRCIHKFEMLRKFFRSQGINFGTNKNT